MEGMIKAERATVNPVKVFSRKSSVLTRPPLFNCVLSLLLCYIVPIKQKKDKNTSKRSLISTHFEPRLASTNRQLKTGGGFGEADGGTGDEEDQWWEDSLLCLSVCSACLLLCSPKCVREFTLSRRLLQAVKE